MDTQKPKNISEPDLAQTRQRCVELLARWGRWAESHWSDQPAAPGSGELLGCFGSGFNSWGVQTNQKYLAAMAVLAHTRDAVPGLAAADTLGAADARQRAIAALRFSMASHKSGRGACTDGTQWGHTWISALGIERMMHAMPLLESVLTGADHAAFRAMMLGESDWLLHEYRRGGAQGVHADVWGLSGRNAPESNIWNGAVLWRTAHLYADAPQADAYIERAHTFLINGVSVPADARNRQIIAGKTVADRFIGANFFPNYALDHHGYMNVGYMTICVSNAAMLHLDAKLTGLPDCPSIHHHQADLWRVLRQMIFPDGRLLRIGGDTRVRYAYCQDYLLPSLCYAAGFLGDEDALVLLDRLVSMMAQEADYNGDGSFYGRRLEAMANGNPYYFTRLESDRAVALGMAVMYLPLAQQALAAHDAEAHQWPPVAVTSDAAAEPWTEPEHGDALHRGPKRIASVAWRANGGPCTLCLPPDDGHLAEWEENLSSAVTFAHAPPRKKDGSLVPAMSREVLRHAVHGLPGGFLTWGAVREGCGVTLAEGWRADASALHQLVFAALPDGQSVVGLQYCQVGPSRRYVTAIRGMGFSIPNDLYNDFSRTLVTSAAGEHTLRAPAPTDQRRLACGPWACIDERIGMVGLYGGDHVVLERSSRRRGGPYETLYTEAFYFPLEAGTRAAEAGELLVDAGWLVAASADAAQTAALYDANREAPLAGLPESMRGVRVHAADGQDYILLANFGDGPAAIPQHALAPDARRLAGADTGAGLSAGEAVLYRA